MNYGPVRRGGAAWWSEGAVAVVGMVVTVVAGDVVGGIVLRVVAGLTGGAIGSSGAGSWGFGPQP